jgi:hypothetical protein
MQISNTESPVVLRYDVDQFPFRRIMASHLRVGSLEMVHKQFGCPAITADNDQETPLHRAMYRVGEQFQSVYRSFVRDWVEPLLGEAVVFQSVPSFRYQAPGTVAVGQWHRDSDFGHGSSEINVWVPLTSTERSSSVWIESAPAAQDCAPVVVPHGSAMLFNAVALTHGNVKNVSRHTRVSFEFRVIRASCYNARSEVSVKQRKAFRVGEYFDRFA